MVRIIQAKNQFKISLNTKVCIENQKDKIWGIILDYFLLTTGSRLVSYGEEDEDELATSQIGLGPIVS